MKLRYLVSALRIMKVPGLFQIIKDWQGFVRMHFLHAAMEGGLLHALPATREELAAKLHVARPDILDGLLDVGVSAGELRLRNGTYSLRGKRAKAVARREGDSLAAMVQAQVTYYGSAYRKAAERMRGGPLGTDLHEIGDLVARYSKLGEPVLAQFLKQLLPSRSGRILDVGCGSGVFLRCVHEADQTATGIGLEVDPAVVRQARDNLAAWGIDRSFAVVAGDIRTHPESGEGPFDLITLFNVLYYFPLEERPALFRRIRSLLAPGGVFGLAASFRSNGKDLNSANLNMVNVSLEGLTPLPDLEETASLLRECGFSRVVRHVFFPGGTFCGLKASIS